MSIHDIIHTDSSVVTAWLSNHGVRLMLIALAVGALAAASRYANADSSGVVVALKLRLENQLCRE